MAQVQFLQVFVADSGRFSALSIDANDVIVGDSGGRGRNRLRRLLRRLRPWRLVLVALRRLGLASGGLGLRIHRPRVE